MRLNTWQSDNIILWITGLFTGIIRYRQNPVESVHIIIVTSVGLWIWSNSQLQTFYQTFLDRGRKSYILQDGNFSTFARTRPASTVRDPFVSHLRRRNMRYKNLTCRATCTWANLLRDKLWVWWKTRNKASHLLLKVDPRSTFRNNFLQPATNIFVARQVDHGRWKTQNIDPKLATKQRCATSWSFLYLAFRRL